MKTGDWIKLFRIKKGINQQDFARKTGITSNYLSLIENGKKEPAVPYLKKASEILDVPLNLLIFEKIDLSKFKDSKSKQLAKKIDKSIADIKKDLLSTVFE